ncbi:MAG: ABC transporter substrate-binding protein [Syntrophorhabdales bacterium]|jgi:branched-chain amino acid transport system substrate-binding protein
MKGMIRITAIVFSVVLLACFSAGAQEAIKIGVIEPLTGPAAYDGQSVVEGAKMAEEEINSKGGVLGRPIRLVVEDGKADPAESVNAAEKLLTRDRVPVIMGAWASSATLAIMPVMKKNTTPLVVETATSLKVTDPPGEWVYRICSNSAIDAMLMEKYLVPVLGFKKVAFMAANNDFGRAVVTFWGEAVKKKGGTVVLNEYHAPGEINFAPSLTKIATSGADSIIITSDIQTASNIIKQTYEMGLAKIKRMVTNGIPSEAIVKLAGAEASEGVLVHNYWVPFASHKGQEAKNKQFVDKYMAKFPNKPVDKYAAFGYDGIRVIAQAIDTARAAEPGKIKEALKKTKMDGLTGNIQFNDKNQALPYSSVSRIEKGKPKLVVHLN